MLDLYTQPIPTVTQAVEARDPVLTDPLLILEAIETVEARTGKAIPHHIIKEIFSV